MEGVDWQEEAACRPGTHHMGRPVNPEWWFPRSGTGGQLGKLICQTICPVQINCLIYAQRHELAGIWGGLAEQERYGRYITAKPRYDE